MILPKPRRSKKGGRPQTVDVREVVNTILYQYRSGCQWDMLPHDLLPKSTVYDYFKRWRDDGTLKRINDVLVGAVQSMEAPSEECEPSAASIDSQSVKTSERSNSCGDDGGRQSRTLTDEGGRSASAAALSPGENEILRSTLWACCWP